MCLGGGGGGGGGGGVGGGGTTHYNRKGGGGVWGKSIATGLGREPVVGCYSAEMRRPAIRSTAHDPILSYPTYQPPIQDVSLQISVPNCVPLRGYTINDIVKQVDPGVECSLYVDDFVIMYRSPTIDAIQRKLQHTIHRLEKWTLENGFTISKNKTVAMHFCPDKKCMDPVLKLDNDPIQFVKEAKFLGLIWDTKLTFEPHIKYLKARCHKSLNILKVLSRTEWGADQTTLLKLYRSLVRSKLDYGCLVYGSASKTALAKLDPVHNQGLRLSLGAFRSSPVESLYVETHEPPLEIRREKLALQYILKLKVNPGNPAYDVVFNPKYQILYADKESATDSFGIHCKKLLKKAKIDVEEIAINSVPDVPIWDSEPVTVDFTLSEFDKSSTSSTVFKSRFNEVKQKYLDFCHIHWWI